MSGELITQAACFGHIRHILGKVTPEELLRVIATHSDEEVFQDAYVTACQQIPLTEHYVDGVHFLTLVKDPWYGACYLAFDGDLGLPAKKDNPEPKVAVIVGPSLLAFHQHSNLRTRALLAAKKHRPSNPNEIVFYGRHNNPKMLPSYYILLNDEITSYKGSISPVFKRIENLQREAPLYWDCVKHMYIAFFRDHPERAAHLSDILRLLPESVPSYLLENPDAVRIFGYRFEVQAYCLGFPLEDGLPGQEEVERALRHLAQVGTTQYLQEIIRFNEQRLAARLAGPFPSAKTINETDTLIDNFTAYNSFDVVVARSEGHTYLFSGPEFEKINSNGQNFYTREKLPTSVLTGVKARLETRRAWGLPAPVSLESLLTTPLQQPTPSRVPTLPDEESYFSSYQLPLLLGFSFPFQ